MGFGKVFGELLVAPLRIANVPVKLATKAICAIEDEPAPKRNVVDKLANSISDSVEETLDDGW